MVAVAQLESVPEGNVPHRRPRPITPGPVVGEDRRPDSVSFPDICTDQQAGLPGKERARYLALVFSHNAATATPALFCSLQA